MTAIHSCPFTPRVNRLFTIWRSQIQLPYWTTFFKAFFAKVFSVKELQGEIKKLLKCSSESYAEILEKIHTNYRALETCELMRESIPAQENTIVTRHATNDDTRYSSPPHAMKESHTTFGTFCPVPTTLSYENGIAIWSRASMFRV